MARWRRLLALVALTAALAQQGARAVRGPSAVTNNAWKLFDADKALCAGRPAHMLAGEEDLGVGPISKVSSSLVPDCPGAGEYSDQAGGHAGTVFSMRGGKLAKLSYAFDDTNLDDTPKSRIEAGKIEFRAYMEMWCLSRLSERNASHEREEPEMDELLMTHRLRHFALGEKPWAPRFYGICKLPGIESDRARFYLVLENMLAAYEKPCQLDLKLGFSTVEFESNAIWKFLSGVTSPQDYKSHLKKYLKQSTHWGSDRMSPSQAKGARLAGFKIFDPYKGKNEKMDSKLFGPLTSLENTFDVFFDKSGHSADKETFEVLQKRLLDMAAWWGEEGKDTTHSVALSTLMAYECKPRRAGTVVIRDITMSHLPLEDGKVYVTAGSRPSKRLYPSVDTKYAENDTVEGVQAKAWSNSRSHAMFRSEVLRRTTAPWNFSAWQGTQFVLDFEEELRELALGVWHGSRHNRFEDDIMLGRIEIDLFSIGNNPVKVCKKLDACSECAQQEVQPPELCLHLQKLSLETPSEKPVPLPQVKLIDYAHFYMKEETPDWPQDGVHEGLASAIMQLDRKVHNTIGFAINRKNMKCPKQGDRELTLSEESCKLYGERQSKRYITWQPLPLDSYSGKCRTCDDLVPRAQGWGSTMRRWRIYRNDETSSQAARASEDKSSIQKARERFSPILRRFALPAKG